MSLEFPRLKLPDQPEEESGRALEKLTIASLALAWSPVSKYKLHLVVARESSLGTELESLTLQNLDTHLIPPKFPTY